MTFLGLSFWEWERLAVQVLILVTLWRIGKAMERLVIDGQRDRHAREEVISDLKNAAIRLEGRTAQALAESEARTGSAERKLEVALKKQPSEETLKQIEVNTRDTVDVLKETKP